MTEREAQADLHQQIVDILRGRAGTHEYTLAMQADEILALVRATDTKVEPPAGWFHFGSHLDWGGPLEFSEVGEDGLPRWERPLPRGEERGQPGQWLPSGAGWREVAEGERFPGGLESVTHLWLARPFDSFHQQRTWVREPFDDVLGDQQD